MEKGILRKAVSLVLALALVIAVMPTMFASESMNDKTYTMTKAFLEATKNEGWSYATTEHGNNGNQTSYVYLRTVTDYYADEDNVRDWKYFSDSLPESWGSAYAAGSSGVYFTYNQSANSWGNWAAIKVRGLKAGTYDINLKHANKDGQGCLVGMYILENEIYKDKTPEEITNALIGNSVGVQKVASVDCYGNPDKDSVPTFVFQKAEIHGDKQTEHIILFKLEGAGTLSEGEFVKNKSTTSTDKMPSRAEVLISELSFTYTGDLPAQNEETFGNTAAFFEKTENNECNVYLVSAIESLNYSKAGFKVAVGDGEAEEIETETVYEKLTVDGVDYTAENFGLGSNAFLYVVKKTLAEGFTGQTINFKPYAVSVDGETTIAGSTYQATLKSN